VISSVMRDALDPSSVIHRDLLAVLSSREMLIQSVGCVQCAIQDNKLYVTRVRNFFCVRSYISEDQLCMWAQGCWARSLGDFLSDGNSYNVGRR